MNKHLYKVKIENSYSGHKRETIVLSEDEETAALGAGVTHDEVVKVDKISAMDLGLGALSVNNRPTSKDLSNFYEGIIECINIGTSMVESLGIVSMQQASPYFRGIIGEMMRDLRSGKTMSDSMTKYPDVFSESTIAILRAGETNGDLKPVLQSLANYERRSALIGSKIKSGMTYPAIVAVMAFLCIMFVSVKLIPAMAQQYKSFNAELPLITRIVMGFSDLVRTQPLFWAGMIIAVALVYSKRRQIMGSKLMGKIMLEAPVMGPLYRKMLVAKMFRVLSMLLTNGTRIGRAFEITALAAGHPEMRAALLDTGQRVIAGDDIHVAFAYNQHIFGKDSAKILAFLRLAAHTGSAGPILTRVANAAEDEVEAQAEIVNKLMEPLMLGLLAVVVGGIIFAVYYPMFNLGSVVMHQSGLTK
ncbi:MAG TPA: type II secretion system F family protein [Opitutales bacterium]|nr:type II secretion system F family protein [Opitutales bacterium]